MSTSTAGKRENLVKFIAAVLILVFVYTAISKLTGGERFRTMLSSAPLVGAYAAWLRWMIPMLEIAVGGLLFFPSTIKAGLIASCVLMSIFTLYISYLLLFESQLPCSCGGVIESLSWKEHLVFNIILLMLAFTGLRLQYPNKIFIAINRVRPKPV